MTRPFSIEEHRNLVRMLRPLLNQLSSVKYPHGTVRLNWTAVDKRSIGAGLQNVDRELITYVLFDDRDRLWTVTFERMSRYIDDLIRKTPRRKFQQRSGRICAQATCAAARQIFQSRAGGR